MSPSRIAVEIHVFLSEWIKCSTTSLAHSIFFWKFIPFFKFPNYNSTPLKILIFPSPITLKWGNMKAWIFTSNKNIKTWHPLYVNENGVGPSSIRIGSEYKLSQEQIKLAINIIMKKVKNYACNNFYFD